MCVWVYENKLWVYENELWVYENELWVYKYMKIKISSSAVQKRHSKVYGNPITPFFYSISP